MDATVPDRRGRGARWPEPLGYPPRRDTISAIQIGAYGDVQPRGVGVVAEHAQSLTYLEGTLPQRRVLDPDLGQARVHGPLQPPRGRDHLRLDEVQQPGQVQALGGPHHPVARQGPPGAGDGGVRVVEPGRPQLLGVRALLHDVAHQPVLHLRGARLAQHAVELVAAELLRPADEEGEQAGRRVAGGPQLAGQRVVGLQPLRHGAQLRQVHAVIVAMPLVDGPDLRLFERAQFVDHLRHGHPGRRLRHARLPSSCADSAYVRRSRPERPTVSP